MNQSPSEKLNVLSVRGCRVHNLKNISVEIPRNSLTVLTGPSGSGKSSLAFDTIYAEGQRRYVESLSAYARQFLEQLSKPDVDAIGGLSPTVSIEQKTTSTSPRSTVGTVTEIYDHLRVLYARLGKPVCFKCGEPIRSQSRTQIVDSILAQQSGCRIAILAPIVRARKGEYQKELTALRQRGFVRVRIDGEVVDLEEEIRLDRTKKHDIEVFVDRLILPTDALQDASLSARVAEAVDLALKLGAGNLLVNDQLYSEKFACTKCGLSYPEPEPRLFSFNSPLGACPECDGLGVLDPEPDFSDEDEATDNATPAYLRPVEICLSCKGHRLRPEALSFFVGDKNIAEFCALSVPEALSFASRLTLSDREKAIGARLIAEIQSRLQFLLDVGVDYLSLDRAASSLSGGEAQRIRLAAQLGSRLVDVIYVLDEPSIGLHPRDHGRLMDSLQKLKSAGNTVIVVEHDRDTMERADWIVDLGPGAGTAGGEVVAVGRLQDIRKSRKSLTGKYLRGDSKVSRPALRVANKFLNIVGVSHHNLKNVSLTLPLGVFVCVTGVSGSGKSSLILESLYPLLLRELNGSKVELSHVTKWSGLEALDKVIEIDQSPIGRTPRSNPATYTGLFTLIRDLFSQLPEAQIRGYKPGRFSFNVEGGRCEACGGDGLKRIEMHFLPDVFVECDLCHGKRYNRETLDITYKGRSISDILKLQVSDAVSVFTAVPKIHEKLRVLNDVGLGYIELGQSATTLSGGEAQRIKLAKELSRRATGKTLYILDEPSTGLHFDDIQKLLSMLQSLVDQGNSVVVIEHNTDIIESADWVIDLGPEGGAGGGSIIAQGTPAEIVHNKASHTGKFLSRGLA